MADIVQFADRREELRRRTKAFALRVIRLYPALSRSTEAQVIGKQLLRSGASVGANYRATCRARSRSEFIARMGVVAEEADETVFWLELLIEAGHASQAAGKPFEGGSRINCDLQRLRSDGAPAVGLGFLDYQITTLPNYQIQRT